MKVAWIAGLALLLAASTTAFAQDKEAAKELEKRAKEKIDKFKKDTRKAKEEAEWIQAIQAMCEIRHEKILRELGNLARTEQRAVLVGMIMDEIVKYGDDPLAASILLGVLDATAPQARKGAEGDEGHEPAVQVLQALGKLKHRPAAKKIEVHFRHINLPLSKAAIMAAGGIGSVESVPSLIIYLQELETLVAQGRYPTNPPPGMGPPPPGMPIPGGGPMPPGMPPGTPTMQQQQQELIEREQRRRQAELDKVIKDALSKITGHSEDDASKWSTWWSANRKALEDKQREEDKKKKP